MHQETCKADYPPEERAIVAIKFTSKGDDQTPDETKDYIDLIYIGAHDKYPNNISNYCLEDGDVDSFVFRGEKPVRYMGKRYTLDEFNILINLMF